MYRRLNFEYLIYNLNEGISFQKFTENCGRASL